MSDTVWSAVQSMGIAVRRESVVRWREGVSTISEQIDPYRQAWEQSNAEALAAGPDGGPLWVVLGDSAAQGVGAQDPFDGWVGQVRRRLEDHDGHPWRVVNLSVSGARVGDVLDEQLPALRRLRQPVELVVCAIGGNDMYRSTTWHMRERFGRLVASLPAADELAEGQRTVLTTLPQGLARRRAEAANRLVRTRAPDRGIEVADLWATTGPPWKGMFADDYFHPNEIGYAAWAAAINPVLRPGSGSAPRGQ